MFLFALIVYAILNAVLSTPRRNMWFTWCGTIVGGFMGIIPSFIHSNIFTSIIPGLSMLILGALAGYYFTPKRQTHN
jgi:hypothetical protein